MFGRLLGSVIAGGQSRSRNDSDPALDDDEEVDVFHGGPDGRKTLSTRKKKGRSRNQVLKDLALDEEMRKMQAEQQLSEAERAFLPLRVRDILQEKGTVPTTPLALTSRGAVLFVDISGFTDLGKELRTKYPPLEAASKLALRINNVLRELTSQCQLYEGDVAKFAGDALLCVWESQDEHMAMERAKGCAVSMLNKVKQVDSSLDLHGGIAMGSLMHFHLGDKRHELRWYLMTGEAVGQATGLVEDAKRGTILCLNPDGTRELLNVESKPKIMLFSQDSLSNLNQSPESDDPDAPPPSNRGRARVNTIDDPFLNLKLTYKGRAYIPKNLRNILAGGRLETGGAEMRNRVAVLFATLPELTMSEEELKTTVVSEDRIRLLNDTFVDITNIVRSLDGEVRDLLFDDKGCVFIAVFGAYGAIEMPELKAAKAARRMTEELEVADVKLGVSVGTCFVGMAGDDKRHDFVVMGHEVNMAARYMGKALPGDVLVSPKVAQMTREFFQYDVQKIMLKKGPIASGMSQRSFRNEADLNGEGDLSKTPMSNVVADPNGMVDAFKPIKEISRRPSFMATYRYTQILSDKFVGRKNEIKKIDAHLGKIIKERTVGALNIVGPRGYGKTALVLKIRRDMEEKFLISLGTAFELESTTPFYVFRQILESLFGLFEDMPKSKAQAVVDMWIKEKVEIDYDHLERILPYICKLVPPPKERPKAMKGRAVRAGSVVTRLLTQGSKLSVRQLDQAFLREGSGGERGSGEFPGEAKDVMGESQAPSAAAPAVRDSMRIRFPSLRMKRKSEAPAASGAAAGAASSATAAAASASSTAASSDNASASAGPPLKPERETSGPPLPRDNSQPPPPSPSRAKAVLVKLGSLSNVMGGGGGSGRHTIATGKPKTEVDKEAKQKKDRIARKMSRGANQFNVLGVKQLESMATLVMALLSVASKDASKVGKKGMMIAFEDSQWLDTSSLQVLEVILEKCKENPKLLPGTCFVISGRTSVSEASETATMPGGQKDMQKLLEMRVLDVLSGLKPHLEVELDELSRSEVDQIVCALLERGTGDSVSKEVLDAMFRNSGGMPNAIADMMELVRQDGTIYLDEGSKLWKWKQDSNQGETVLHAARAAFIARIDNLSVEAKDVLKIAACTCDAKNRFKLHDLVKVIEADLATKSRYVRASHAAGITEPRLAYYLQPAVTVGLVKYSRGFVSSTEEWAFASSAIAEAVQEMVPVERQEEISQIAADIDAEAKGKNVAGLAKDFGM